MKVVFDSNIYVSALVFPGGVAEVALRAANEGKFELVISRAILAEVLDVLARKFSRDGEALARTALAIAAMGEMVTPSSHVDVLADAADNRILECALAAQAHVIVTGDRQMLALGTWQGIEVLPLREFLDRLAQGTSAHQGRAPYRVRRGTGTRKRKTGAAKERARRENKTAAVYGIRPFPKRGNAVVTNEMVDKLREGEL